MSRALVERTATNDHYTIVRKVSHEFMNDPTFDLSSVLKEMAEDSAWYFADDRPAFNVGDTLSIKVEVMS